jgi:hypothetical protein
LLATRALVAPATEAHAATPADPSRPARAARTDTKPALQKSFYDSLEQEMASLLGERKPDKNP